jgi:hypothetical protein
MENIIGHLSKLAIEHKLDDAGINRYYLSAKSIKVEVNE